MALKTGLSLLALGALFLGSAAHAAPQASQHAASPATQSQHLRGRRPQPAPPANAQGRYELKSVKQWVPGYTEKVWVQRECRHSQHRRGERCEGGYYQQRQVPGHYETVEEWVWVPAPSRRPQGPAWNAWASR
ncbi:hypothetical protein [Stigmatella erecta]|uniref:YXWGXW repeat-containing protein n=1 Tax=Stigmatella erecta TaxID=83460 RepID=A0A1I0FHB6_9BACT|nr:hypothetical protein [Stigmatella erecta]SET57510.1 hypothetical protein SAMN05443639_103407 [Stigmatella erecta]